MNRPFHLSWINLFHLSLHFIQLHTSSINVVQCVSGGYETWLYSRLRCLADCNSLLWTVCLYLGDSCFFCHARMSTEVVNVSQFLIGPLASHPLCKTRILWWSLSAVTILAWSEGRHLPDSENAVTSKSKSATDCFSCFDVKICMYIYCTGNLTYK